MPKRNRAEYMKEYRRRKKAEARKKRIEEWEKAGEYEEQEEEYYPEKEEADIIPYAQKEEKGKKVIAEEIPKPICLVCGIEFEKGCCSSIKHPRFCSKSCSRAYQKYHPKQRQELMEEWKQTDYAKWLRGKEEW